MKANSDPHVKAAVSAAVRRFLGSPRVRTLTLGGNESVTVEFKRDRDESGDYLLLVAPWSIEGLRIKLPVTYGEAVSLRLKAQLGMIDLPHLAFDLYCDIIRRVDRYAAAA